MVCREGEDRAGGMDEKGSKRVICVHKVLEYPFAHSAMVATVMKSGCTIENLTTVSQGQRARPLTSIALPISLERDVKLHMSRNRIVTLGSEGWWGADMG